MAFYSKKTVFCGGEARYQKYFKTNLFLYNLYKGLFSMGRKMPKFFNSKYNFTVIASHEIIKYFLNLIETYLIWSLIQIKFYFQSTIYTYRALSQISSFFLLCLYSQSENIFFSSKRHVISLYCYFMKLYFYRQIYLALLV